MLPRRQSAVGTWKETEARLTRERFARFGCDLDSRTQNSIVRATGKVASEKEESSSVRRASVCISARPHFREESTSRRTPYCNSMGLYP